MMLIQLLLGATLAISAAVGPHASVGAAADIVTRPTAAWQADDPADSLYRRAREQLNRGEYDAASRSFARIPVEFPRSVYAGDALYWEAYARYSTGGAEQLRAALVALDAQRKRYAKASTRGDADALAVRVRGALARLGDNTAAREVTESATAEAKPCTNGRRNDDSDDDERIAAMNALLQMNAERAMPILRTVLARRDACSTGLRKKAVFLVSQLRTPETESILLDIVRNDPAPEIRKTAVFWLGQVHSDRAAGALEELLRTSTNDELRKTAVQALMQQNSPRGTAAVRAIAEDERASQGIREQAVFWLGQAPRGDNATFLRGLFDRLAGKTGDANDGVRQKILFSLSQMKGEGNEKWLMQVATDAKQSVPVRKQAIFAAGQLGIAAPELIALYPRLTERELKKQLIWVLAEQRSPAAIDRLMEIAKRDADPEMRKQAIFWLGQSDDARVKQFLIDIING